MLPATGWLVMWLLAAPPVDVGGTDGTATAEPLAAPEPATLCTRRGARAGWVRWPAVPVPTRSRVRYTARLRLDDFAPGGELFVALRLLDADGRAIAELFGARHPDFADRGWQTVAGECLTHPAATAVQVQVHADGDFTLAAGSATVEVIEALPNTPPLDPIRLANQRIDVLIAPGDGAVTVTDRRGGTVWRTHGSGDFDGREAVVSPGGEVVLSGYHRPTGAPLRVTWQLVGDEPELRQTTSLPADVPMPSWAVTVDSPPAFRLSAGELVVPYGEGFLYRVDDPELPTQLMQTADGAGLTMPWFGAMTDADGPAAMCLVETDADALARMYRRPDGDAPRGVVQLVWMSRLGRWGYDRSVRYWFAPAGGYNALCARYRRDAEERGLLVSLAEKQRRLPRLERLLGAPKLWLNFLWHRPEAERYEALRWLRDRGLERAVLGNAECLASTDELLGWGWLASQYDQYADIWRPDDRVAGVHQRHFDEADVRVRANGSLARGWVQRTPDGDFAGFNLCPTTYRRWAERYIPPDLARRTMTNRFLDTVTALPLGECHGPEHPLSREQDRAARRALLGYLGELGLIAGSEMGVHWAVPDLAYSEGLLSPVGYRHPEAGYLLPDMEPVPATDRFMLNPAVRVPLWELVFHDCQVAYWYWGDATNTFPDRWAERNAFGALYAVPPLYMILKGEDVWLRQRERIVATELFFRPLWPAIGWNALVEHRFLGADRRLQMTRFANGARVIVNFADAPGRHDGREIPPLGYLLVAPDGVVTVVPAA